MKTTIRSTIALAAGLLAAVLFCPFPAHAQYVFLDVDGDGMCGPDVLTAASTSVDIWFDTAHNADGSPAVCAGGPGFTLLSYEFILSSNGSVSYGAYTNLIPEFPTPFGATFGGNDYHNGFGINPSYLPLPPDRYKVGTLAISVVPGTSPVLNLVPSTTLNPGFLTAFGSQCPGMEYDNTIKLGSDFMDACGTVGPPPPSGAVIAVSPLSHDFGKVNVGTVAAFDFAVSNTGDAPLTIAGAASTDPQYTASFGSITVAPGGSTLMTVAYAPSANTPAPAAITIASDATDPHYIVNVDGRGNTAPVLAFSVPSPAALNAFVPFTLQVTGTDAELDAVTYTHPVASELPVGATFDVNTGLFQWTPGLSDGGTYTLTICGTDGHATSCEPYTLTVTADCMPPIADPDGPYSAGVGQPIQFDGTGSSSPDGSPLAYLWDFGDGNTGSGPAPAHAYALPRTYLVTLTVTTLGCTVPLSTSATTSATVLEIIQAQAFFKTSHGKVKTFGAQKQLVGLEPVGRPATEIVPSTVKMSATVCATGAVMAVAKGASIGDMDNDGIPDLDVNFDRADLDLLLGCAPNNSLVTVNLSAATTGGLPVLATAAIKVSTKSGAAVSAFASPNPFNPETSITYAVRTGGTVTIRVYSLQGRLVRTLASGYAGPGGHEVRWNGRDDSGRSVSSGLYLVNVAQGGDSSTLKVVVAK
jgi:PKD repeat protein